MEKGLILELNDSLMRFRFLLLASEGDAFGQGVGKRLEDCECHLQGRSFLACYGRLTNFSFLTHILLFCTCLVFLLGYSGVTLILMFVEWEETPNFVNA